MGLQQRTIQKLLREGFSGAAPLVVAAAERGSLGADLKGRLERLGGVDTKDHGYVPDEEKTRFVCAFTITQPGTYHYYGAGGRFRLLLDDDGRLTLEATYGGHAALVSDLDEIVRFVRHCKLRLERHKALEAKRGKVRELLAKAILVQVRKLAKEELFDFISQTDAQKLKLFVKLSEEHAVVLDIPFKEFKKFLPQLRSAIVTLRQLYRTGIRFHIVGRRKLPWRTSWVKHDSV